MNRPILVIGVQRTGTSAVAGILFRLGVYMGDFFLKKDKHNPTGYFEDIDFINLDEDRWKGKIAKKEWEVKVKEIFKRREKEIYGFTRWGWKNPASSYYTEDYIKLCNPIIIWCKRNKEDTIKSMKKMYWNNGAELQYKHKIEWLDKLEDYLEINFEDLIGNTEYEIGKIIGYLKLKPTKQRIDKAINSIIKEPNLKENEIEPYSEYL